MHERRSRLTDWEHDCLIVHFVAGVTGRAAGELVGVHRNTASSFHARLRKVIGRAFGELIVKSRCRRR